MSESERRRKYRYDRVLIETARVLSPQFDPAVVYLTGSQIEMLRNMTQYLRRLETYVTTYAEGYYIAPTVAEYDDLLEIVADLEEVLMGNENTIWGYKERWVDKKDEQASGTNDLFLVMTSVPAGEVWVLEEAYAHHAADSTIELKIYVVGNSDYFYLVRYPSASPVIYHRWTGSIALSEGDFVAAWFVSPGEGKRCDFAVWGHKMAVPT